MKQKSKKWTLPKLVPNKKYIQSSILGNDKIINFTNDKYDVHVTEKK